MRGLAGKVLWPDVSYHEFEAGGRTYRAKVAAMTLAQFQAAVTGQGMDTTIWTRFVQPAAFRSLRAELFEVRTDLAATLVREGEFTEPAPGLTVYAQSVDGQGNLQNLFIHQVKSDGATTTYTAESGRIGRAQGRPVPLA